MQPNPELEKPTEGFGYQLFKKDQFSKTRLGIFALVFALIGGFIIWKTFAAAPLGSALPARMPFSSGGGGTFYVDGTNGNDSNNGSSASPWKTINKGLNTVPLKGSIIKVRPGTYYSNGNSYAVQFNRLADVTDPITLTAETPGTVIIANSNINAVTIGAWIINASGLRVQGMTFRIVTNKINQGGDGILVENSDKIEFSNNVINEAPTIGFIVRGGKTNANSSADDVWVINNTFRPSSNNVYQQISGVGWTSDQYFGSKGSHFMYVGQVGDSSTTTAYTSGAVRTVIANNVFVGVAAGRHIELGPEARYGYVVNNTFYANRSDMIGLSTGAKYAGGGIEFFSNVAGASYSTSYNMVKNNVFVDMFGHGAYGSGSTETGNVVDNNMAFNLKNGAGYADDQSLDFEPHYGGTSGAVLFSLGSGNFKADPMFVNPTGFDYHLQPGSPAAAKADPAYAYPTDRDGKARSSTPSLGAYELGGSTVTPPPPATPPPPPANPPPPPPSNLTVTQNIQIGQTLSGTVTWTATPNSAVANISFDMDNNKALSTVDATPPYSRVLDTTTLTNGTHALGLTVTLTDGTVVWQPYQIGNVTISNTTTPTPPPPPPAAPTISLKANPNSITQGSSSSLTWSSTGSTACSASGAWSGTKATTGSQAVAPITTLTYSLTCSGSGGSATASATIGVLATPLPPPPSTLDTTPPTVPTGFKVTSTSKSSVSLVWNASTDNKAVAGYRLYRGTITTPIYDGSSLGITNTGLNKGTSYTYYVRAYDKAGNISAPGAKICVGKWGFWNNFSRSRSWKYC